MHTQAKTSVAVALDTTDLALACHWAALVDQHVQLVKLGLEFYLRHGLAGVVQVRESAPSTGLFLDLKLHDIPATVAGAARAIESLQPDYLTVHAAGGAAMVEAAATQLPDTRIAAVTVLTSLSSSDIAGLGLAPAAELVPLWAESAVNAGARAIVASAQEVADLRSRQPDAIHLITPGIRPAGSDSNDQSRVATPTKAILDGADVLVIGRPITQSDDPGAAAAAVMVEVAAAHYQG